MRIFVEVPVWLGDTIMASVAIKNLADHFGGAKFTVFGSFVATEVYKDFDFVEKVVVDTSKKQGNRYINLYKLAKSMGKFDIAFSFRRSFASKVMFYFLDAPQKYKYKRLSKDSIHQVKRYNDFVNFSLGTTLALTDLQLPFAKQQSERKLLGINPGATYGSAKRWYPQEFANVAIALQNEYDIVIFGGPTEVDVAGDIENILIQNGVNNYTNIAGKTSIKELCQQISALSLFVTNDSGPLHVAAVYKIKTIAIFGPTIEIETHGWNNPNEIIIKKNLTCQPCMKRVCPLGHHECMKLISANDVLGVL